MRPGLCWSSALLLVLSACHASTRPAPGHDAGSTSTDAGGLPTTDGGTMADAGQDDAGLDAGPTCNFAVNYPLHYPCNQNADCQSGHCATGLNSSTGQPPVGICTERCDTQGDDSACPMNFICDYAIDDTGFSTYCLPGPNVTTLPPGDHTLPFGSPCSSSNDCAGSGTLCGVINEGSKSYSFCSPPCDPTTDDPLCEGCGQCEHIFTGQSTNCLPQGPGKIGAPCKTRTDCASFVCADFCTEVCGGVTQVQCPDDSICVDDGQMQSICIDPSQQNANATGSSCLFDFQCVGGDKCLGNSSGVPVCTHIGLYGEPCKGSAFCGTGLECLPLDSTVAVCTKGCPPGCGLGSDCVAPDLDTAVLLFTSATAQSPTAQNDDANPNTKWSSLTYSLSPGTYWIAVTANTASINGSAIVYGGNYQLSILDGVNAPVQAVELPEDPTNNDTIANAQPLAQVPVVVSGTLEVRPNTSTADLDFYQFTLMQAATLTFSTAAGAPSACVPSGRMLGDPCWTKDNCASHLCDSSLNTCTQTCTSDGDCGTDGHCVMTSEGQTCAAGAQYQSVKAGGDCKYDWQCGDGNHCAQYGTNQVCAPLCVDAGSNCDPSSTECAAVTLNQQGQTTSSKACVPLGNRSGAFGSTCLLQSDCGTGLQCSNDLCTASCTTTADCPNQKLAPAPGDMSTDVCRPCVNDADCGLGLCLQGPGYERFCGDPCDAMGQCAAGFNCVQSVSYSGQGCAPAAGSCRAPTCQMNQCELPKASYAEACLQDSDCSTGSCVNGLCSHTCQADADCACTTGDLTCQTGTCQWSKNLIATQSPNGTFQAAQALTGSGPWKIWGEFQPGNGVSQNYYSFKAAQGSKLTIRAEPVCGTGSTGLSSALELMNSSGGLLTQDFPWSSFPKIVNYSVATTDTYVISLYDYGFGNTQPAAYILSIEVQ